MDIAWGTKVITVYRADTFMTDLGSDNYEMDVDGFRLALRDEEDSENGQPFPHTHNHVTEVTIGGVTYARLVEIINGYTVTFDDDQYTVFAVGANHNLADVKNPNQVSLVVNNSAGLVSQGLILKHLRNSRVLGTDTETLYDDDGTTVLDSWTVADKDDADVILSTGDPAKRTRN